MARHNQARQDRETREVEAVVEVGSETETVPEVVLVPEVETVPETVLEAEAETVPETKAEAEVESENGSESETTFLSVKIGDTSLTLPRRYAVGHTLTDSEAFALDAFYSRAFTNAATAAAKKLKASGKEVKDAATLLADYAKYAPNVGARSGETDGDDLTQAIALKFWNDLATRHNRAVDAGQPPILRKAVHAALFLRAPAKTVAISAAVHSALLETYNERKEKTIAAIVAHVEYGPKIVALVEADLAAKKAETDAKKLAKATATVSGTTVVIPAIADTDDLL